MDPCIIIHQQTLKLCQTLKVNVNSLNHDVCFNKCFSLWFLRIVTMINRILILGSDIICWTHREKCSANQYFLSDPRSFNFWRLMRIFATKRAKGFCSSREKQLDSPIRQRIWDLWCKEGGRHNMGDETLCSMILSGAIIQRCDFLSIFNTNPRFLLIVEIHVLKTGLSAII